MGFGSGFGVNFTASTRFKSSGGGPTEAASVDACLALARASGADGDAYKDTSNGLAMTFFKPSGTPGWLVPSVLYGSLGSSLMTNASGQAYVTLADAKSDLTGRGWSLQEPVGSVLSKAAGGPLILDSTAANLAPILYFIPSSTPATTADVLTIAKIEIVVHPSTRDKQALYWLVRDGSKDRWITSNDASEPGEYQWATASSLLGTTSIDVDSNAAWFWAIHAGSVMDKSAILTPASTDGLKLFRGQSDTSSALSSGYSNFGSTSYTTSMIGVNGGNPAQRMKIQVEEFCVAVMS